MKIALAMVLAPPLLLCVIFAWLWGYTYMTLPSSEDYLSALARQRLPCPVKSEPELNSLEAIPVHFQNAFVAGEAPDHWEQRGIPTLRALTGVASALLLTSNDGKRAPLSWPMTSGLQRPEQTMAYTLRRMVLSDKLELQQSREILLLAYMNAVYLGNPQRASLAAPALTSARPHPMCRSPKRRH